MHESFNQDEPDRMQCSDAEKERTMSPKSRRKCSFDTALWKLTIPISDLYARDPKKASDPKKEKRKAFKKGNRREAIDHVTAP